MMSSFCAPLVLMRWVGAVLVDSAVGVAAAAVVVLLLPVAQRKDRVNT